MSNHYSVHLKLIWYCMSTTFQFLRKPFHCHSMGGQGDSAVEAQGGDRILGETESVRTGKEWPPITRTGVLHQRKQASLTAPVQKQWAESKTAALERRACSDQEKGPWCKKQLTRGRRGGGDQRDRERRGRTGRTVQSLEGWGLSFLWRLRNSPQELLCVIYNLFCAILLELSVLN